MLAANPPAEGEGGIRLDGGGVNVLALFKHVIGNFSATTAEGGMADCRRFLLDRENLDFPGKYRLFMFAVPEQGGRDVGNRMGDAVSGSGGGCLLLLPPLQRFPRGSSSSTSSNPTSSQTGLVAR